MKHNPTNCECSDYSKQTAYTGIATISAGTSSLDGTGSTLVLTAGQNGAVIKSIIIKALSATTVGMVRIFISNGSGNPTYSLIREVPIPTYPMTVTTPTPSPIWPLLEIDLIDEIKLKPGFQIRATTQNSEKFNIIAESIDWEYPNPLPDTCCNFVQETANTGIGIVRTGSNKLDGSGSTTIFTAAQNGSIIKSITITALQSTHPGMVRFFIGPDVNSLVLMMEVTVPASTQSAFQPSFKAVLPENYFLQSGYIIAVTTELSEAFSITIGGIDWQYPL